MHECKVAIGCACCFYCHEPGHRHCVVFCLLIIFILRRRVSENKKKGSSNEKNREYTEKTERTHPSQITIDDTRKSHQMLAVRHLVLSVQAVVFIIPASSFILHPPSSFFTVLSSSYTLSLLDSASFVVCILLIGAVVTYEAVVCRDLRQNNTIELFVRPAIEQITWSLSLCLAVHSGMSSVRLFFLSIIDLRFTIMIMIIWHVELPLATISLLGSRLQSRTAYYDGGVLSIGRGNIPLPDISSTEKRHV